MKRLGTPALTVLVHTDLSLLVFEEKTSETPLGVCIKTARRLFLIQGPRSAMISHIQSNLGLTDKCGPTTVRCWKKSAKRKRSVPHYVTIVCTSTANIAYHNASKRGIIMSLRQRSTISRFVGY